MFEGKENAATSGEKEKVKIEEMKLTIETAIIRLTRLAEIGATERCEKATDQLRLLLKNPALPAKFCTQCQDAIRALMLHAFTQATSMAANSALQAAMEDNVEKRDACIKQARTNLAGAMKHKAPEEFVAKCERILETATLTGGVKATGPTAAKPEDALPEC